MRKNILMLLVMVGLISCAGAQQKKEEVKTCSQSDMNALGVVLVTPMSLAKETEELKTEKLNLVELNFMLKRFKRAETDCEKYNDMNVSCKLEEKGLSYDALESMKTVCYGTLEKSKKTIEEKIRKELVK